MEFKALKTQVLGFENGFSSSPVSNPTYERLMLY
jgi:hypothetical protein